MVTENTGANRSIFERYSLLTFSSDKPSVYLGRLCNRFVSRFLRGGGNRGNPGGGRRGQMMRLCVSSLGLHDKSPSSGWLKTHLFSHSLEARSRKSKCWPVGFF